MIAQLTPQVLSAAYPLVFLNLPGMKIAYYLALFVEWTGIAHSVWLLAVLIKNFFFNCTKVCIYKNPVKYQKISN